MLRFPTFAPFVLTSVLIAASVATSGCGSACDAMYIPSFTVHVIDGKTGADIAGATLTFDHGITGTTNAQGVYAGPNNADSGDWSVTAAAAGHHSQTVPFQVQSRACHNVGPDLTVSLAPSP